MKSKVLAALRSRKGYVSGQELCENLGVSRAAVWKGVQKLKQEGYRIEAIPNKGYCLMDSPDVLNAEELKNFRKTAWAGTQIVYYDVTDSTNIQAKRLAEEGASHGTLVVAGRQEAGRGRRGRSWESPEKDGIFMTLLLRPDFKPKEASMLTIVAAMAVTKAIQTMYGIRAGIKWPNDIVLNGKKICGILTEMNTEIDAINYVVVGIGINISNRKFESEASFIATSLEAESGKTIHRAKLIAAVLEQFEFYYDKFCKAKDLSDIMEEYNRYLVNMDRQVRILDPKEPFTGISRGITEKGELIVTAENGTKLVSSGEVSVRGIYGYV